MKLVVCERFLDVQTAKQHDKNWQLVGAPGGGGPSRGSTSTMFNPALPARRSWERCKLLRLGLGRNPGRKNIISIFGTQEQWRRNHQALGTRAPHFSK